MPTASRKQATKRAPAHEAGRRMREAQQLRRVTRRARNLADKPNEGDILIDHDFHAPPAKTPTNETPADEIEIDPQLDDSESAEP